MEHAGCASTDDVGILRVVSKVGGKLPPIVVAGGLQLQSRQHDEADAGSCRNWDAPCDYCETQGMAHACPAVALPSGGGAGDTQTVGEVCGRHIAQWVLKRRAVCWVGGV